MLGITALHQLAFNTQNNWHKPGVMSCDQLALNTYFKTKA